jgi:hypothetical protein
MTEHSKEAALPPMAGKKFYRAGVIAAYTALANMPVGCVLCGLNMRARGSVAIGRLFIALGLVSGAGLSWVFLFGPPASRSLTLLSLFTALCFYRFERGPVKIALQHGASLARWWPPALWLLGTLAVLFAIACILP